MTLDDIVKGLRERTLTIENCGIFEGTEEAEIIRYMLKHPEHSSYTAKNTLLVEKHGPVPDGWNTWGDYWKYGV